MATFALLEFLDCGKERSYFVFYIKVYRVTMSSPKIRVVPLTENAIIPTRGSTRAAGLDLYSAYDLTVPARGSISVVTDLQIHVPGGFYDRIAPRSGLALHH